ncbi:MAG: hypothetical protein J5I94_20370 [Phaeodactylibacter sp.]|nr:hypothetical protein [Phaeodactylibacter sp.]
MVAPNTQTLTAVFLYSRKDEAFKEEFGDYLKMLQRGDHLLGLDFLDIESLSPYRLQEKLDKVDFFIFSSSVHLFAHPNMRAPLFRQIMRHHHAGRLRVVTICCRPWDLEDTVLNGAIRFPRDGRPLNGSNGKMDDEACRQIFNKLRQLCDNWRGRKTQMEYAWKRARAMDTAEAYYAFLKKHPLSKYAREARERADELDEATAWKNAEKEKDVNSYYHYLLASSPEKKRLEEAALSITNIEEDEERFWEDIKEQEGPEFFFRYKAMFPNGKYIQEADEMIQKFFDKPPALANTPEKQPAHNTLNHLAHKRLSEEEHYSLTSYLLFCGEKRFHLEEAIYWGWWKWYFNAVLLLSVPALVVFFYVLLKQLLFFEYGVSKTLLGLSAIIAFLYTGLRVYGSFTLLRKDWESLMDADKFFRRASALLKVGFISNDAKRVWDTMAQLSRMDKKLRRIEHKNILHYLLPEKKIEGA